MSEEEASASSHSSEEPEEDAESQPQEEETAPAAPKAPEAPKVPDGFTEIPPSEGSLDVSGVRGNKAALVLLKLPPNFDVKALHGKAIRMKKAVDSAGAVGTVELDDGNFSLIATSTEEFARCVNAFPSGRTGYRLGRPFAAGLTLVSTPDLPPNPSAEAASDGGGARDKPRPHPPLKLRWRPPGSTTAPPAPPIPESIKRKQKRLSVHFDAATKQATPVSSAKRASEDATQEARKKAKSPKEDAASPDAEAKQKKHKSSPSPAASTPKPKEKKDKESRKDKSPAAAEPEAVVSPPPSKKSRSKEKE